MVVCGISGGAFYLRSQIAAIYTAYDSYNFNPNVFIGTSAGAIISAVSAICGIDKAWKAAQSINPADAITGNAFNEKGGLSFCSKIKPIFGKYPVGLNVVYILDLLISKAEFNAWLQNPNRVQCFVTTCNVETGRRAVWDLSKLDREKAIIVLQASCSMQGMNKPVSIDGCLHWDGGQLDHNPLHLIFDLDEYGLQPVEPKEILAIWSRPDKWQAESKDLKKAGYFDMLGRMIELDNIEKSNNDQQRLESKCEKHGIKPVQIFIDRVLANYYDSSEDGQNKAVQSAIKATHKAFKKPITNEKSNL